MDENRRVGAVGVVLLVGTLVSACSGSGEVGPPLCEAEEIASALADAQSGDTVRVGACRVRGSFTIPAGVTLAGGGREVSLLEGPAGTVAVFALPGDPPSRIVDLAIESHGTYGIAALGAGDVVVERVDVRAETGMGIGAEELRHLEMTDVTLTGALTEENQNLPPEDLATHGLALVRVTQADLTDVVATRFAQFGAVIVEGSTTWIRGGAPANLNHGLLVSGGEVDLQELDLSCTIERGLDDLAPAAAAVFRSGAAVESVGLVADSGEGYGLVHDDVRAVHVDLTARGNELTGSWVQNSESFELSGEATNLYRNGQAGLLAIATSSVIVRGGIAGITDTEIRQTIVQVGGESANVPIGDGIEIVGPVDSVVLEDLKLGNNARVGVIVDLRSGSADLTMTNVTVEGSGDQLGAIVQQGDPPEGWDAGVTRHGATEANDAAQTVPLDVAGIIEPDNLPDAGNLADGIGLP